MIILRSLACLYNKGAPNLLLLSTAAVTNASPILEKKIEYTTAGLPSSFAKHLSSTGENNVVTIIEYIAAVKNEVNLSDNYRRDLIESLARFSKYNDNKSFKDLHVLMLLHFWSLYARQRHRIQCTNGSVPTTFSGFIYYDFSSGSIILISSPTKGLNLAS
jgi:hypothetical protein